MEKTVEGGDPEKCQVDHKPSAIMGDSNSCCGGEPAHAESAEDCNGNMPRHERFTDEAGGRRYDRSKAPKPQDGSNKADDVRTGLTQAGIVGVKCVLRCQRESHPRRHESRDECDENRRRMGELREKSCRTQCPNKCDARTQPTDSCKMVKRACHGSISRLFVFRRLTNRQTHVLCQTASGETGFAPERPRANRPTC